MEDGKDEGGLKEKLEGNPLLDRLRVSVIKTVETEAQKHGMTVSQVVVSALADLTTQFIEQLAKDLEKFAQHAGRKSVNMDDVILAAHRNEEVAALLRSYSQELLKDQQGEKKRKKASGKGKGLFLSKFHSFFPVFVHYL